jgi:hypothetical protein
MPRKQPDLNFGCFQNGRHRDLITEDLQQRGPKQLLWRKRRAARIRIDRLKLCGQLRKCRVDHLSYRVQRMLLGNNCFWGKVAEKTFLMDVGSAHRMRFRFHGSINSHFTNVRPVQD